MVSNEVEDFMIQIPTLDEVVCLVNRRLLINIEVKAPADEEYRNCYDIPRKIEILYRKIKSGFDFDRCSLPISGFCYLSSFDHRFLADYSDYEERR